jgi:hypothetical protein
MGPTTSRAASRWGPDDDGRDDYDDEDEDDDDVDDDDDDVCGWCQVVKTFTSDAAYDPVHVINVSEAAVDVNRLVIKH